MRQLFSFMVASLTALYSTLDPTSVAQHFAFYELYPKTVEGKQALKVAWDLLSGGRSGSDPEMVLPTLDPKPIINFVNRSSQTNFEMLTEEELAVIEKLSQHLGNRKLKGSHIWDQQALLSLPPEEIDLARGLMLVVMGGGADLKNKVRSYEASMDLMALQISARLTKEAGPLEKIRAINDYIFSEMRFRFPPHSLHAKDIDVYTFLPSVLDGRRGVCLGVSILYLCLAQRLGLELEAITPPGHIYVRHRSSEGLITNIETTARGIDIPSERYLGIETKKLQTRTIKEVIGLAFMNQAAVSWHREDSKTAATLYEKAQPFLKEDYLLNMFLGFNYLFIGKIQEGKTLLKQVKGHIPEHAISADTITEDYLLGRADAEAIQAVYAEVDETRDSILKKQKKLEGVVQQFPHFRQAVFHLAVTYLQLGREKEALPLLEKYIEMNPEDPTVNYYIAAIQFQRKNFNKAWKFLKQSEAIVFPKDHQPRALKDLRKALLRSCPEA